METRRFFIKSTIFAAPLAVALLVEVLLLPEDAFCYRCWEALKAASFKQWLPGPFYPDRRIARSETGDLGHRSEYAVTRKVVWETDRFGYRAGRIDASSCAVVIVGDSCTAGSGLTQEETIAAALSRALDLPVYPYAPCKNLGYLLHDHRFHPEVIVLQKIERKIPRLPRPADRAGTRLSLCRTTDEAVILMDRMAKMAMLRNTRSRIRSALGDGVYRLLTGRERPMPLPLAEVGTDDRTLFLQGAAGRAEVGADGVARCVERIARCHEAVKARSKQFVFMPVPDKENILFRRIHGAAEPTFLTNLMARLLERGIPCVDLQTPYREARARGIEIYQSDDSHWSAEGVRIAAKALARKIREGVTGTRR